MNRLYKHGVLFFLLAIFSHFLWAGCSPYIGLASINEVSKEHPFFNNVNDFIEVKKLDNQLNNATISSWSLEICETIFTVFSSCSGVLPLSAASIKGKYWTLYGSPAPSSYIDWQGGFDVVLRDENNDVIDYLSVNNITPQFENCVYVYPITASGSNSTRRTFRTPDGVGPWDVPPGNSVPPTGGEDNSSDPPPANAPSLQFLTDVVVNQGGSATLTMVLSAAYTSDVTINYASVNGDAIAGVDYTSVSGMVVIPAGQLSRTVTVNTLVTGKTTDHYFFLTIESATNADVVDQVAQVTILQASLADHFSITHSGVGINCEAKEVMISAKNSSGNIMSGYTGTIQLSTNLNHGDWGVVSAQGTLINGALDSGNGQYTFVAQDNGQVTLSLSNTHVESINMNVQDGYGITETSNNAQASDDENLQFLASTFRFFYDDGLGSEFDNFVNFTANKPIKNNSNLDAIKLRAITTDVNTGQCIGLFSGLQTIELAMECIEPNSCDSSIQSRLLVNGAVVTENPQSAVANYANVTLNFTANSTASLENMTYSDAGRIRLHARKGLIGSNIVGISNAMEFYPAGFCLQVNDSNHACVGNNETEYANCSVFKMAGEFFSATISAQGWQANNDTGFCDNNAPLLSFNGSVDLSAKLISPSSGSPGYLNTSSTVLSASSNTMNLAWSEMGVLAVSMGGNSYLSADLPQNDSSAIGRWRPAQFRLTKVLDGSFSDANNGFSYSGQLTNSAQGAIGYGVSPEYEFVALNNFATPDVLQNYIGAFYKNPQPTIEIQSATLGKDALTPLQLVGSFASHVFAYNTSTDSYSSSFNILDHFYYVRDTNSEVAPYTEQPELSITEFSDSDGVLGNPLVFSPVTGEIRYGRIRIDNAYGSETQPITQLLFAEYYDGIQYQLNTLDDNTDASTLNFTDFVVTNVGNSSAPLLVSDTSVTGEVFDTGPLQSGIWRFVWSAPLNSHFGEIQFRYTVPSWLKYNWDESTDGMQEDPAASVVFGQYRGHDKIIYWKELYYE